MRTSEVGAQPRRESGQANNKQGGLQRANRRKKRFRFLRLLCDGPGKNKSLGLNKGEDRARAHARQGGEHDKPARALA